MHIYLLEAPKMSFDGKQIGSTTRDVHLIDIKKISQGFNWNI